ncbi:MAG: DNA repair protein RecO [Candidatus Berkelbacteria bacterium]|nr:DNA repair protein RecO [Candidatus Berkelbacteria bacterium]
MRNYKLEAIVIKKRNFAEKDRILTLFSKEKGKTEALAKGSRRPGSKLAPYSDLGTLARFYISRTNSIDIVKEISPIFVPEGARGNFLRTQKISYLLKFTDKIFEVDESHPKTYFVLKSAIQQICEREFQLTALVFLANCIDELGLEPELFVCQKCRRKIASKEKVVFSPKVGILHRSCDAEGNPEILENETKLLRLIFNSPYEKIVKAKVDEKIFGRSYQSLLKFVEWHFGKVLPEGAM